MKIFKKLCLLIAIAIGTQTTQTINAQPTGDVLNHDQDGSLEGFTDQMRGKYWDTLKWEPGITRNLMMSHIYANVNTQCQKNGKRTVTADECADMVYHQMKDVELSPSQYTGMGNAQTNLKTNAIEYKPQPNKGTNLRYGVAPHPDDPDFYLVIVKLRCYNPQQGSYIAPTAQSKSKDSTPSTIIVPAPSVTVNDNDTTVIYLTQNQTNVDSSTHITINEGDTHIYESAEEGFPAEERYAPYLDYVQPSYGPQPWFQASAQFGWSPSYPSYQLPGGCHGHSSPGSNSGSNSNSNNNQSSGGNATNQTIINIHQYFTGVTPTDSVRPGGPANPPNGPIDEHPPIAYAPVPPENRSGVSPGVQATPRSTSLLTPGEGRGDGMPVKGNVNDASPNTQNVVATNTSRDEHSAPSAPVKNATQSSPSPSYGTPGTDPRVNAPVIKPAGNMSPVPSDSYTSRATPKGNVSKPTGSGTPPSRDNVVLSAEQYQPVVANNNVPKKNVVNPTGEKRDTDYNNSVSPGETPRDKPVVNNPNYLNVRHDGVKTSPDQNRTQEELRASAFKKAKDALDKNRSGNYPSGKEVNTSFSNNPNSRTTNDHNDQVRNNFSDSRNSKPDNTDKRKLSTSDPYNRNNSNRQNNLSERVTAERQDYNVKSEFDKGRGQFKPNLQPHSAPQKGNSANNQRGNGSVGPQQVKSNSAPVYQVSPQQSRSNSSGGNGGSNNSIRKSR